MSFGPREIAVIVLLIVLLFGARRIPELMRSLGSGFREFKKGIQGEDEKRDRRRLPEDDERRSDRQ
jgi:sec-independent protein translocase protein TatA